MVRSQTTTKAASFNTKNTKLGSIDGKKIKFAKSAQCNVKLIDCPCKLLDNIHTWQTAQKISNHFINQLEPIISMQTRNIALLNGLGKPNAIIAIR